MTFVSEDGAFGGPLSVALAQCTELAARGHQVTLLAAWDGRFRLRVPDVRVVLSRGRQLPGGGFSGLRASALNRWLRKNRDSIDVVHVHAGRHLVDLELASTARRLDLPYVLQTHGMLMPTDSALARLLDGALTRQLLRDAHCVLTLSTIEADGLEQLEPRARQERIHNGLQPVGGVRKHRSGDAEVLFLARLHPRKRVMAFAEMAVLLHERGVGARFTVVGPDEGDLASLQALMASHPDVPLSYEGPVTPGSGASRIAAADVYVLPSFGEVFPMSVLEALAAATPVVMTKDCAIADQLSKAGAAMVTDGTSSTLASAVESLLASPTLQRDQAAAGLDHLVRELGATSMATDLERIYAAVPDQSDKPRIVWVTNQAPPYRLPVWEALAAHAEVEVWLLENDATTRVDANNRGEDWEVNGRTFPFSVRFLKTLAVRRGEARHYLWLAAYSRRLRGRDAVLIGGWDSPAYLQVLFQARLSGVRTIGFYESHAASQQHSGGPLAVLRRLFFRSLDGVVVPGIASKETLIADGVDRSKLYQGFNAVDVARIKAETDRIRREKPARRSAGHLRLLVVGQLIPRKNVEAAIQALAEPGLESATLTIVGTGQEEGTLRALADAAGVEARTVFSGYVTSDQMPAVFADHDILIHPATLEVWGLVVNEALAAGLHVVVSDRAGVAASVENMPGTCVVEPTSTAIARAVGTIRDLTPIDNPPILRHDPAAFAETFLAALTPKHAGQIN